MSKLYQKFLFKAGAAVKSENKIANCYGRFVVFILSTIFHLQHYNFADLVNEVEIHNPNVSEKEKKKLIKETKRAYFKYRCTAKEYYIYELKNKSKREIKNYLFDIEKIVLIYLINSRKDLALLNDKKKAYDKLKKYYKRDIISIEKNDSTTFDKFNCFVKKHPEFIVKANNLSCGRGIQVYKLNQQDLSDDYLLNIYKDICAKSPVVIEEILHNNKTLNAYYDKALNRLRITVFKTKDGQIHISNCYFGFGSLGKETVNGATGGIEILLDPETGAAISKGVSYALSHKEYDNHPDSGLPFKDLRIEKWDEMLDMVYKLSKELPTVKYVGWDLALTNKGWCVIEGNGNASQETYQVMKKKSNREHFMKYYYLT